MAKVGDFEVAFLKLPLPLPLLQTAIMEIRAILKAQTDAAATSSKSLPLPLKTAIPLVMHHVN